MADLEKRYNRMARQSPDKPETDSTPAPADETAGKPDTGKRQPREVGGPKGLEPTRYGDWEKGGRCIDF